MSGAACKAAECSLQWNENQTPMEKHLRAVASHPEFTSAIGRKHDKGGKKGKKLFFKWIGLLEQAPMTDEDMDEVQGIIDQLTKIRKRFHAT